MSLVRPRSLVHRGRHLAAGVVLEQRLLGDQESARRALTLWEPGVRVFRLDGGLLVRFPRPRALDATAAPGHLALEVDGRLLALPLDAAEREALAPAPGSVVVARGGAVAVLMVGPELEPAAWVPLDAAYLSVKPLGPPPAEPPPPPPASHPDVRATLALAPAAPELPRVAAALAGALGSRPIGRGARAVRGAGHLMARLRAWLRPPARPGHSAHAPPPPAAPPGPVVRALRRAWVRLVLLTRVTRLAGLRQGAYLGRLLAMFDRGDLEDALRHAIPLGGGETPDSVPSLGVPGARSSLSIRPGAPVARSSLGLGSELYQRMREVYRAAFQQLEAQGKHEQAAFVLAELLRADAEAVSYLERHGQLRLAAELAEARRLPPGLVVRQWFVAGDFARATHLARAYGAYADAVQRLERSGQRTEAEALRLCWAEDRAEAGDLEAAVFIAQPLASARPLALRWVELAVAAGGEAGPALLGAWLALAPESFPRVRDQVLAACADDGEDGPARRAAVARGLLAVRGARTVLVRAVARPLARALLCDRAGGSAGPDRTGQLLALSGDGPLRADMPHGAPVPPVAASLDLVLGADDRGTRPALDAAVLPGGRVLVALGEAGAELRTRDGRVMALFDVPAHRLVVADHGGQALALAPRGEATRVSRLDLLARRCTPVRDLRVRAFADTYDGVRWVVAGERSVLVLDTLRDDLRAMWTVQELPGTPAALGRDGEVITFCCADGIGSVEGWLYDHLQLRRRAPLSLGGEVVLGLAASGGAWYAAQAGPDGAIAVRALGRDERSARPLEGAEGLVHLAGGPMLVATIATPCALEVRAIAPHTLLARARVRLSGAESVTVRQGPAGLTLADSCGRVIGLDLSLGRVTHDLRA